MYRMLARSTKQMLGSTSAWLPAVSGSALLWLLALPLAGQASFETGPDRVAIKINGQPFSVLHFGKEEHKPFLFPLLTASGKNILRGFPVSPLPGDSLDHPHQRGLWVGSENVLGPSGKEDFWENDPLYPQEHKGSIVFEKLIAATTGDEKGTLVFETHWISSEGRLWVIERRTITFYSKPADCRMFDVEIDLEATEAITFEDGQDAVLGMRLSLPFDVHYGATILNEDGVRDAAVRGRRSSWLDWTADLGPMEYRTTPHGAGERVGVAVFDHPSNLNYPTRWHLRDFGFLAVNPFGGQAFDKAIPKADFTMKRGDRLHLRYRILIHPAAVSISPFVKDWESRK